MHFVISIRLNIVKHKIFNKIYIMCNRKMTKSDMTSQFMKYNTVHDQLVLEI